jgi:hypothetical protein
MVARLIYLLGGRAGLVVLWLVAGLQLLGVVRL